MGQLQVAGLHALSNALFNGSKLWCNKLIKLLSISTKFTHANTIELFMYW
jgi:hypothetical protein